MTTSRPELAEKRLSPEDEPHSAEASARVSSEQGPIPRSCEQSVGVPQEVQHDSSLPSAHQLRSDRNDSGSLTNGANLTTLHETLASLLASKGQWREAYDHLRSALDLIHRSHNEPNHFPDQLRREVDRLRREHAEAREQSIRDSLTASYNRRYLDQRLVALLAEQTGSPHGIAVALVDLDWFKSVNDTYGHLIGDRVLQQVVELLQEGLPQNAFCARYGGEEFALVMPDIQPATAIAVSEAARARVQRYPWSTIATGLRVTISIGVAHEHSGIDAGAEHQLLEADSLLYSAKQSGRNAVAYRDNGRVWLAGGAAARRIVTDTPFVDPSVELSPRVAGYR